MILQIDVHEIVVVTSIYTQLINPLFTFYSISNSDTCTRGTTARMGGQPERPSWDYDRWWQGRYQIDVVQRRVQGGGEEIFFQFIDPLIHF